MKLNDIVNSIIKLYEFASKEIISRRDNRNLELDLALVAVQSAANETRLYLSSIAKGKKTNDDKERELSALWRTAGFSIRGIDANLAQALMEKSDYWLDPSSYNLVEMGDVNIGLQHVVKEAKILLKR